MILRRSLLAINLRNKGELFIVHDASLKNEIEEHREERIELNVQKKDERSENMQVDAELR